MCVCVYTIDKQHSCTSPLIQSAVVTHANAINIVDTSAHSDPQGDEQCLTIKLLKVPVSLGEVNNVFVQPHLQAKVYNKSHYGHTL